MKNACIALFAIVMIVLLVAVAGTNDNRYSKNGEVVEIWGKEVIVVDDTDTAFAFFGDNFSIGDKVKITFSTNGTLDTRIDDEIKNVVILY